MRSGWEEFERPNSVVYHIGSSTSNPAGDKAGRTATEIFIIGTAGLQILLKKNWSPTSPWVLLFILVVLFVCLMAPGPMDRPSPTLRTNMEVENHEQNP